MGFVGISLVIPVPQCLTCINGPIATCLHIWCSQSSTLIYTPFPPRYYAVRITGQGLGPIVGLRHGGVSLPGM
ncbi:uncharacterized protein P884DRAFT_29859 [Thermothelomyces heterothallicus CBS 202.75]|uniref:uncharacterized protein n=1 Tax=Thermothelomyces heterothallicus CBS 202.75 TaxID=1149848 RepID=UPI0037443E68